MRITFAPTRRRVLTTAVILILALLLVPYFASRMLASGRAIRIRTSGDARVVSHAHESITICAYNIAHGRGLHKSNFTGESAETRLQRLHDIADFLVSTDADVVVLNEVDFCSAWSGQQNQAQIIARRAGYPHWVEQTNIDLTIGCWSTRFGNAVLSRFPIVQARLIELPPHARWERQAAGCKRAVACLLDLGDRRIEVVGIHLEHRDEATRILAANKLETDIRERPHPVILAGDFNSAPAGFPNAETNPHGETALGQLIATGQFHHVPPTLTAVQPTFPSESPKSVLDWVLLTSSLSFKWYEVADVRFSDHRPVVARIELRPHQTDPSGKTGATAPRDSTAITLPGFSFHARRPMLNSRPNPR